MEIKLRLYLLENGEKFMGIGVYWLLNEIRKNGSLRKAALELKLSYSKAFRMISGLEKVLGYKVLERHHGGMARDGAVLTEFGEEYILLFEQLQSKAEKMISGEFQIFHEKLDALERKHPEAMAKGAIDDTKEV